MKLSKKISVALMLVLSLCLCMVCGVFAACGEEEEKKPDPLTFNAFTSGATASVNVGEEVTLKVKSNRNPLSEEVIEWKSDKESVATVTNGKVKGIAEGEANITATFGENKAACKVTVTLKKEISLDKESLVVYVGGEDVTLTATCTKGGVADASAKVVWSSSDENVLTVKDGKITAVDSENAIGNAIVTADYDGVKATCSVKVINSAKGYDVPVGNSNANILKDPGTWFYFAKTSSGINTYEGAVIKRTTDEKGEVLTCHFDKIETIEGKDPESQELYLRIMPTYAEGSQYQVSFHFVCNIAGRVEVGDDKYTFEANEEFDFSSIQTVSKTPLNVKLFLVGENIDFTLTAVTLTDDFQLPETPETPEA